MGSTGRRGRAEGGLRARGWGAGLVKGHGRGGVRGPRAALSPAPADAGRSRTPERNATFAKSLRGGSSAYVHAAPNLAPTPSPSHFPLPQPRRQWGNDRGVNVRRRKGRGLRWGGRCVLRPAQQPAPWPGPGWARGARGNSPRQGGRPQQGRAANPVSPCRDRTAPLHRCTTLQLAPRPAFEPFAPALTATSPRHRVAEGRPSPPPPPSRSPCSLLPSPLAGNRSGASSPRPRFPARVPAGGGGPAAPGKGSRTGVAARGRRGGWGAAPRRRPGLGVGWGEAEAARRGCRPGPRPGLQGVAWPGRGPGAGRAVQVQC